MEKFEISEKYRKYFIEIILDGTSYYTVWGADMNDDENDKLLSENKKLILFRDRRTFKEQAVNYKNVFFDHINFEEWIIKESIQETYCSYNLNTIVKLSSGSLKNKKVGLALIDILNLMQDFYIQIKDKKEIFSSKLLLDFKDNLYNNHFWKNDHYEDPFDDNDIIKIKNVLLELYNDFISHIQFI